MVRGHTKENPGYWLHTGGTGILTFWDSRDDFKTMGTWSDRQYNDLDRVDELTSLPDDAFHRNVDKIVLEAGQKHSDVLKTCIICPPTIYGEYPRLESLHANDGQAKGEVQLPEEVDRSTSSRSLS